MIMKKKFVIICGVIILLVAFTHLWLPQAVDECQKDVTHRGHLPGLAPFHCIAHSERDYPQDEWNHVHPWMDREWEEKHTHIRQN